MAETSLLGRWWGRLLFGVLLILFGVVAIAWPGITVEVFVTVFGVFILVMGIVGLFYGFAERDFQAHRALRIVQGLVGIVIGLIAIVFPGDAAVAIVYLVGIWMILVGVFDLAGAGWVPKDMSRFLGRYTRFSWALSGIIFIVVGLLIIVFPGLTILAVVWVIGLIAIILGVLSLISALASKAG
jgi:uncharacterized membrane protein HdeD (DUF308 family)